MSVQIFWPFLSFWCCFLSFWYWVVRVLCLFWILTPCQIILLARISSYAVCGLFAQGPSKSGTSLVVQRLRLCASNAAGHKGFLWEASKESICNVGDQTQVWSLGWEDPLGKRTTSLLEKWRPTPLFWPREFHGLYSPCGHKELDMTEWLSLSPKS